MDFSWAENYPEIYKICTLFDLKELKYPKNYGYKALPSYIQDGPQCGLVALTMALGRATKDFVDILLKQAKELNFTYNGEMFNAENLVILAQSYLPKRNVQLYEGSLFTNEIKNTLKAGKLLLVPYDSDKDNSPCLENGKKAHWAVVSGYVESDDFYVLSRHGKARNVAVWKLRDLAQSNSQLNEIAPSRKLAQNTNYKIPAGGIATGLKEKAIILSLD